MNVNFKIEGVDNLLRNITAVENALNGHGMSLLMLAAAEVVVERAQSLAPVDTGTLQRSIHLEIVEGGSSSEVEIVIGSDVDYAPHQEYGTTTTPAHPFLRPAIEQTKDKYYDNLSKSVMGAIEGRLR